MNKHKLLIAVGQRFGELTIVREEPRTGPRRKRAFLARCDCGNEAVVLLEKLTQGRTRSCGCLVRRCRTKHGLARRGKQTSLYNVWRGIIYRCAVEDRYAGRGIRVTPEWDDYSAFAKWAIANGWRPGLVVDRFNNDGNYTPFNCRIVTRAINNQNRSPAVDAVSATGISLPG